MVLGTRDVRSNGFAPQGHVATGGRGELFLALSRVGPGTGIVFLKFNGSRAGGDKCSRVGRVDNFFRGTAGS